MIMRDQLDNDPKFILELGSKISKQHIIACWVAIAVNTIWSLYSYLLYFENNLLYLAVGISISFIIFAAIKLKERLQISPQLLGMIPMFLMTSYFSFTYSHLDLHEFQQFTYIYVAMFLGAGMFLLWSIEYSVITIITTLIANIFFFKLFSSLNFDQIMINGGILSISTAFFMIISIHTRYKSVLRDVYSKIALIDKQEELKKAEAESRLLFSHNPNPMLIYSLDDLSILDVNEIMIEKYGYTKEEFLKMTISQLRKENDAEKLLQDIEDVKNGIEKVSEWIHLQKNGDEIIVEVIAKSIKSLGKKARLVSIKDITESKLIQEKKHESGEEHRLLFENNPVAMFVFSEDTQRILSVNKAAEDKYGYSNEDFLNLQLIDELLYEKLLEIVKSNFNINNEWVHIIKSGDIITLKSETRKINFSGENVILVSLNDITEIKENEKALHRAKKTAEKAKEYQGQFLSNMSHEIRTPMNGITGMSRLLMKTKQTKEQSKYTKAIFTSANNLMVIINEILDFSKIEAGKLTIEKTSFNLKELAHIWEETLNLIAEEQHINFNINIHSDVPNDLIGDPIRLNQIIYNLVGNAIKFSKKGEVSVEIYVKENKQNKVILQFDIIDNGIGIPEDKIDNIFSSFTQASSNTTRKYGGTGLGLTITKQLIELQNGEIWVESEVGKGSTFSFILDYNIGTEKNVDKEPLKEQKNSLKNKLGNLNILLVEDNHINQILAITILEGWGFKVDLAENGEEAVEKVANAQYDLILMDIHMPKMDGYEATLQIRNNLKNTTPIIALTASALASENKKCFKAGMNDFVSKPFDPDVLLTKINHQIKQKKA